MPTRQPPALRGVLLLLILVLSGLFASACAASEANAVPTVAAVEEEVRLPETGLAAYYAKRYNGRKTHSGQRHDPKKLTAAHADLPHGTRVLVRNLRNGREVVVTVNDRCRKKNVPFIDLSREAARRLGFLGKGTARVEILPLPPKEDVAEPKKSEIPSAG